MPLEIDLDLEPLALRAIVGIAGDLLGGDPVALVVSLLDLAELLAGRPARGLVSQVLRLEFCGIEVKAASLGAGGSPGYRDGARRRVFVAQRGRCICRQQPGAARRQASGAI